jgi:dihydrofolate reductase
MGRVIVNLSLSLDGVMQAPGRPDEDTRGGFAHGGWARPYFDPAMAGAGAADPNEGPALLFGRRTYEDFFAVWPARVGNPFTEVLNQSRKYVASRTLAEPLPWGRSTLLPGEATDAVAELKTRPGPDLVILGSGCLVRALMATGLIDEYVLSLHPLVLGSGHRLFPDAGPLAALRLTDTKTTATGVVIATYRPAGTEA